MLDSLNFKYTQVIAPRKRCAMYNMHPRLVQITIRPSEGVCGFFKECVVIDKFATRRVVPKTGIGSFVFLKIFGHFRAR